MIAVNQRRNGVVYSVTRIEIVQLNPRITYNNASLPNWNEPRINKVKRIKQMKVKHVRVVDGLNIIQQERC